MRALAAFGAPPRDLSEPDFARPGVTYQIGVPPGRIELQVDFIGRAAFIRNKRATGRTKDLADAEGL